MNDLPSQRLFYQGSALSVIQQGDEDSQCIFQGASLLLGQCGGAPPAKANLCATDVQGSVLSCLVTPQNLRLRYMAYGYSAPQTSPLGFTGQRRDHATGGYLLGNGYRHYSAVLMRFASADSWSPFGEGGLNAYAYCAGDPVNNTDVTGHMRWPTLKSLRRSIVEPVASSLGVGDFNSAVLTQKLTAKNAASFTPRQLAKTRQLLKGDLKFLRREREQLKAEISLSNNSGAGARLIFAENQDLFRLNVEEKLILNKRTTQSFRASLEWADSVFTSDASPPVAKTQASSKLMGDVRKP